MDYETTRLQLLPINGQCDSLLWVPLTPGPSFSGVVKRHLSGRANLSYESVATRIGDGSVALAEIGCR